MIITLLLQVLITVYYNNISIRAVYRFRIFYARRACILIIFDVVLKSNVFATSVVQKKKKKIAPPLNNNKTIDLLLLFVAVAVPSVSAVRA